MQPAGQVAQLLESRRQVLLRRIDRIAGHSRLSLQLRLRDPQVERDRDQSLLRAVVQVPLEPPALRVARPDQLGT